MIMTLRRYSKSLRKYLLVIFLVTPFLLGVPYLSYATGTLFFGGYPSLYNVRFAQFFYTVSTYKPPFIMTPPYAHYQLSRTYFIIGDFDRAIIEAKKELTLYPDHTKAYYILGLTYGYMSDNYQAIEYFTKYIERNPSSWAGRNDKAWLLFKVGDIDEAIETLKPVVENYAFTPWVQNTYCALLIAKKKYLDAEMYCLRAKVAVQRMDRDDWGRAYPGNDPRIYTDGLSAMKKSIEKNLTLIKENTIQ